MVFGVAALIAVLAVGVASAAEGGMATEVRFGPKGLTIGQHWTGEGVPPAERELQVELDKDLQIQADGVPSCSQGPSIQTGVPFEKVCAGAQVGSGEETILVAFPESMPIKVPAKVQIFKGSDRDGALTLYVYGRFSTPISGTLLTKVTITRIHDNRLGWLVDAKFPQVAGGSGKLLKLHLTLGHGIVSSRCPDRKLEANARIGFEDGTSEESPPSGLCAAAVRGV